VSFEFYSTCTASDHRPIPVFAAAWSSSNPAEMAFLGRLGTRDCEEHLVMNTDEEIMKRNGRDCVTFNRGDTIVEIQSDTELWWLNHCDTVFQQFVKRILFIIQAKYFYACNLHRKN